MDPRIRTALWALAGLALAIGISMAAFAAAGGRLSEPIGSVRVIPTADEQQPEPVPTPSRSAEPTRSSTSSAAPSPSDDHGGGSNSGSGSGSGPDQGSGSGSGSGSDDGLSHDGTDD